MSILTTIEADFETVIAGITKYVPGLAQAKPATVSELFAFVENVGLSGLETALPVAVKSILTAAPSAESAAIVGYVASLVKAKAKGSFGPLYGVFDVLWNRYQGTLTDTVTRLITEAEGAIDKAVPVFPAAAPATADAHVASGAAVRTTTSTSPAMSRFLLNEVNATGQVIRNIGTFPDEAAAQAAANAEPPSGSGHYVVGPVS